MKSIQTQTAIAALLASLIGMPCMAEQISYSILARQKLDQVDIENVPEHIVYGLTQNCSAPEGMHFELIWLRATITTEKGEKAKLYRNRPNPVLFSENKEVPCIAMRDEFGTYTRVRQPYLKIRQDTRMIGDMQAVYVVSNNVESLVLKIDNDHSLQLPKLGNGNITPVQIKGDFSIIKSEFHNELTTKCHLPVSGSLSTDTPNIWKPVSGKFLVVQIKADLSEKIPEQYGVVTFKPEYFAITLPSGFMIKPVGALTPWAISEQRYPMNKGRMKDGSWNSPMTCELVFVVPSSFNETSKMKLVFLPDLQK